MWGGKVLKLLLTVNIFTLKAHAPVKTLAEERDRLLCCKSLVLCSDDSLWQDLFGTKPLLSSKAVRTNLLKLHLGKAFLTFGQESAFRTLALYVRSETLAPSWKAATRFVHPLRRAPENIVEQLLPYTFLKPQLLFTAMDCTSVAYRPAYHRLEFLGDSILEVLAHQFWERKYPAIPSSKINEIAAASVNNRCLGGMAIRLGFAHYLKGLSSTLSRRVARSIEAMIAKERANTMGQYWEDCPIPKTLGDVMEAIFGAIYVDSQANWSVVQATFDCLFAEPFLQYFNVNDLWVHPLDQFLKQGRKTCLKITTTNGKNSKNQAVFVHGHELVYVYEVGGEGEARRELGRRALELMQNMNLSPKGDIGASTRRLKQTEFKAKKFITAEISGLTVLIAFGGRMPFFFKALI
ncbi:Dicer-like protein 1 [Mortierella claussenii]|nr:Dicer-like protein 1 [Mortierella claussenii]